MNTLSTVSGTLNTLKEEGYILDFNLKSDCVARGMQLHPADFSIDKVYRFEGSSNPADSAIVYAISSVTGLKGTLLDAYGVYADTLNTEMVKKLKFNRN